MERIQQQHHHRHRHASAASTSSGTSSAPRRRFASPMSIPYNLSDSEEVEERVGKSAQEEQASEGMSELRTLCAQQANELQALTNLLAERTFAEQLVQRMESESVEYNTFLHELLQLAAPTATRHRLLARGDVNAAQPPTRAKSAEKDESEAISVVMNRVREAILMQQQRLRQLEVAAEERMAAEEAAARERDVLTQHVPHQANAATTNNDSSIDTLRAQLDEMRRQRDEMTGRLRVVQDELELQKRTTGQVERELRLRTMEVAELRRLLSKKTEEELKRAKETQEPQSTSSSRSLIRSRHSRVFTGAAYTLLYTHKPDVLRDAVLRAACGALQLPYGFLSVADIHTAAHSLEIELDVRHDATRLPTEKVDLRLLECGFDEVTTLAAEAAAECLTAREADLQAAKAEVKALHERLHAMQATLDAQRSERAANDDEVQQTLDETAETITSLHAAVRQTSAELANTQAALAEATQRVTSAVHEAETLRQNLQESRAQTTTTSVRCTMAEKAKARLEEALRAAETAALQQITALQENVQRMESELVKLRQASCEATERATLQTKVAELEQQLKSSQAALQRANTTAEAEARQRHALEEKLCRVAEEKAAVTRQCAELEIDMQDFAKIQASLQDDLGVARVALRASEQDKQALREQLALLQQQQHEENDGAAAAGKHSTLQESSNTSTPHNNNSHEVKLHEDNDEESSLAEMSMVLVNLVVTLRYCLRCLRLSTTHIPSSLSAAAHKGDSTSEESRSGPETQSFVSPEHVLCIASEAYELVRHLKHALNKPTTTTTTTEAVAAAGALPDTVQASSQALLPTTSSVMVQGKPPRTSAAAAVAHGTEETRQGSKLPLPSSSSRCAPALLTSRDERPKSGTNNASSGVRHGSTSNSSSSTRQVYKRSAGSASQHATRGYVRSASASAAFAEAEHHRPDVKTRTNACTSSATVASTSMHGFVRLPSTPTTGTLRRPVLGSEGRSVVSSVPLGGGNTAERRRSNDCNENATASNGSTRLVPPPPPTNVFRRSYTATSGTTTTTTLVRTPSGTRCPL